MSLTILLIAEILVSVLLVATIATCARLHQRIVRLKADEVTMRKTIGELVIASETAERAIAGLRTTLSECDRTLAERLRTAERYASDLAAQVEAGEDVLVRIARIVEASQLLAPTGQQANANDYVMTQSVQAANERLADHAHHSAHHNSLASSPVEQRLSKAASIAQGMVDRAVRRLESQAA
jgi:hypothetical protein